MDAVGEVCIVLATSRMGSDHIKLGSQAGLQFLSKYGDIEQNFWDFCSRLSI